MAETSSSGSVAPAPGRQVHTPETDERKTRNVSVKDLRLTDEQEEEEEAEKEEKEEEEKEVGGHVTCTKWLQCHLSRTLSQAFPFRSKKSQRVHHIVSVSTSLTAHTEFY